MQKQGLACQDNVSAEFHPNKCFIRCVDYIVVISKTNILSDKIKYFIKQSLIQYKSWCNLNITKMIQPWVMPE